MGERAQRRRPARMSEWFSRVSAAGMILFGGLLALSGCSSTGRWSADMVVPKAKGIVDTRQIVPLGASPRLVTGWECNNAPLFLQPGGNAFVSKGVLRSLRRNFSEQAQGLLKASGDWSVTDYGLWNTTCVHYSGIVATIRPASLGKISAAPFSPGRSGPAIASRTLPRSRTVAPGTEGQAVPVPVASSQGSSDSRPVREMAVAPAIGAKTSAPGVGRVPKISPKPAAPGVEIARIEPWMMPETADISHDLPAYGGESVSRGGGSGGSVPGATPGASVSPASGSKIVPPVPVASSQGRAVSRPVREAAVAPALGAKTSAPGVGRAPKISPKPSVSQVKIARIEPWMMPETADISHDLPAFGGESVSRGGGSGGSVPGATPGASVSPAAGAPQIAPLRTASPQGSVVSRPVREAAVAPAIGAKPPAPGVGRAPKISPKPAAPGVEIPRIEPWMTPEPQPFYH